MCRSMHKFLTLSQHLKHVFISKKEEGNKQKRFWRRAFKKGLQLQLKCWKLQHKEHFLRVFMCLHHSAREREPTALYDPLAVVTVNIWKLQHHAAISNLTGQSFTRVRIAFLSILLLSSNFIKIKRFFFPLFFAR